MNRCFVPWMLYLLWWSKPKIHMLRPLPLPQLNQKSHYVRLLQEVLVSRQQLLQSALFEGTLDKLPLTTPTLAPPPGDQPPPSNAMSLKKKANKTYKRWMTCSHVYIYILVDFWPCMIVMAALPIPEVDGVQTCFTIYHNDWRMFTPDFKPVATLIFKLWMSKSETLAHVQVVPFSHPIVSIKFCSGRCLLLPWSIIRSAGVWWLA